MFSFLNSSRGFRNSATPLRSEADKVKPSSMVGAASSPSKAGAQASDAIPGRPKISPTALDRTFLIWSGHYKNKSEIPGSIDHEVIQKTRSWARIRINLIAIGIAALGSVAMVYLGKQAAKRGEYIESENLEWHRKNREEYLRSTETAKTQS